MPRRPCSKPGHFNDYSAMGRRCGDCVAEKQRRYRQRGKRAKAEGFTREQYANQQSILDSLGVSDGIPSEAPTYSLPESFGYMLEDANLLDIQGATVRPTQHYEMDGAE